MTQSLRKLISRQEVETSYNQINNQLIGLLGRTKKAAPVKANSLDSLFSVASFKTSKSD